MLVRVRAEDVVVGDTVQVGDDYLTVTEVKEVGKYLLEIRFDNGLVMWPLDCDYFMVKE